MVIIKKASLTVMIILGVLSIIFLVLGGFAPLLSIAFGILFLYYLLIYLSSNVVAKRKSRILTYLLCFLFAIPILWGLFGFESLIDFLLSDINIDMK